MMSNRDPLLRHCPACGAPAETGKTCPWCGREYPFDPSPETAGAAPVLTPDGPVWADDLATPAPSFAPRRRDYPAQPAQADIDPRPVAGTLAPTLRRSVTTGCLVTVLALLACGGLSWLISTQIESSIPLYLLLLLSFGAAVTAGLGAGLLRVFRR